MVLPYLYREGKIIKGDSSGLLDRCPTLILYPRTGAFTVRNKKIKCSLSSL